MSWCLKYDLLRANIDMTLSTPQSQMSAKPGETMGDLQYTFFIPPFSPLAVV